MHRRKKFILIPAILTLLTLAFLSAALAADVKFANDMDTHWSKGYVWYLQEQGLVKGYPDGTFRPDQLVTRAEFTHMFMNVFKNQYTKTNRIMTPTNPAGSIQKFSDAANIPDWAKNSVEEAVKFGIINGTPDGGFNPDDGITRAEAMTIVGRTMLAEYDMNELNYFIDEIPVWAQDSVAKVKSAGLIEAKKDGLFKPDELITRGELAKIFLIYYCGEDIIDN